MTLTFRPIDLASVDDVVAACCNRLDTAELNNGNGKPDQQYAAYLKSRSAQNPSYVSFALNGDEIIGQVELTNGKSSDGGYINLIYVAEPYRGRGYGKQVLAWAEALFKNVGFRIARLTSWELNTGNTEFYIKQGWICLGPRRDAAPGFLSWEKTLMQEGSLR